MIKCVFEIFLLLLAGIPLLIYPVVMMSFGMGMSRGFGDDVGFLLKITSVASMLASTLYPLVYLCSVVGFVVFSIKKNAQWARKFAWFPITTCASIIVLVLLWHVSGILGL